MEVKTEMYLKLFNENTTAIKDLEGIIINEEKDISKIYSKIYDVLTSLKNAQREAEEIYIAG